MFKISLARQIKYGACCVLLALGMFLAPLPMLGATDAKAAGGTRTLWLHFTHTGEEKKITFRRNGRYDPKGIKELQWILRDWRQNEAAKMDPRLFDLIWSVYQESGATQAIRVVSGYRSLKTNNALRRRSRGVARRSQHTAGKAMDFFIPGVPVRRLREIGLKMHAGGVGYYPGSGTPFVHMDTGRVRHWPRMTPKQLAQLFPDGKTLHVSTNGKKLPRYTQALAEYNANQNKVLNPLTRSKRTQIASAEQKKERRGLAGFFRRNRADTPQTTKPIAVAATIAEKPASAPKPRKAPGKAPEADIATPKIIANRLDDTNTTPIPSRIGRTEEKEPVKPSEVKPSETVVAAVNVPAPRALPEGLREQFAPDKAIVIAQAPTPVIRPPRFAEQNSGNQTIASADVQPQIVSANTSRAAGDAAHIIDTGPTASLGVTEPETLPSRILTSAPEGEQAEVETTIVRNTLTTDPTGLVLNEKSRSNERELVAPTTTALAYALAVQPEARAPSITNQSFNARFEGSNAQVTTSELPPLKANLDAVSELAAKLARFKDALPKPKPVYNRFAAFDGETAMPSLTLDDLGLSAETHDWFARHKATLNAQKVSAEVKKSYAPFHASLTNMTIQFEFFGKRPQLVSSLLNPASMIDETRVTFNLPKSDKIPSLFNNPDRVYGEPLYAKAEREISALAFSGNTISITPTRDYLGDVGLRVTKLFD